MEQTRTEAIETMLRVPELFHEDLKERDLDYLDIFFEEMSSQFVIPPENPMEPVGLIIWADNGNYAPDEFPSAFRQAILGILDYDRSRYLEFKDGFAYIFVVDNAIEALKQTRRCIAAAVSASIGWLDAEWGITFFQSSHETASR